jgi:hypothetical protein
MGTMRETKGKFQNAFESYLGWLLIERIETKVPPLVSCTSTDIRFHYKLCPILLKSNIESIYWYLRLD